MTTDVDTAGFSAAPALGDAVGGADDGAAVGIDVSAGTVVEIPPCAATPAEGGISAVIESAVDTLPGTRSAVAYARPNVYETCPAFAFDTVTFTPGATTPLPSGCTTGWT